MDQKLFTALSCIRLALDDCTNRGSADLDREGLIRFTLLYGKAVKVTREEVEKVLDTPIAVLANLK